MSMPAGPQGIDGGPDVESRLQDGIYYRTVDRPPGRCYRLVLLDIAQGATRREAGEAIADVWAMLQDLRLGTIRELDPTPAEDARKANAAKLTCLLGFGTTLFTRFREMHPPRGVVPLANLTFPCLPWVGGRDRRRGEADVALQLIADTDLAVDRALVETWMLIAKKNHLTFVTYYSGFNRDDRRSWIGFHDGISNVDPGRRREVIEVPVNDPPWMLGGTYMGFLRLGIDLAAWRGRTRAEQEVLIGRDKLTGCPVTSLHPTTGRPVPLAGCPLGANGRNSAAYIEPPAPPVAERLLRRSHMHRSNPNRWGVADADNRIYRQGYEFLETMDDGRLRVGLNFVSFQRDLARLTAILKLSAWLGDANFAGVADGDTGALALVSLIGGGFYAVPPKDGAFPGSQLFNPGG